MTPKFSRVAAVAIATLLVVPAAWAQTSPDAFERAVAAKQEQESTPIVSPDAVDRANAARATLRSAPARVPDVVERAVAARSTTGRTLIFDRYRDFPQPIDQPGPVASASDRDIEWPQVGAGFAIGILLALGLVLASRGLRIRPLAH
jgi:hypothetical protein